MSTPITVQGYKKLEAELEALKKERPEVILAIKEAREEGDLKENAGYHAARERQGLIEARINYIEGWLPQFTVIDISKLSGDKVIFGATVSLLNVDTDEEKQYTLVGSEETDTATNRISINSPVARALLGHEVGDEVTITIPRGTVTYEITDITFNGSFHRRPRPSPIGPDRQSGHIIQITAGHTSAATAARQQKGRSQWLRPFF